MPLTVPSTLPPASAARSTITLPGRIVAICASLISRGAGFPGNQRGSDDDVLLGDVAGHQLGLSLLIFGRHFRRVAARTFALDPGDILDEDRLGAERLDLFLRRRADVRGADLRAEPLGGGDRLQAGDPDAHDEDFGRADRAGGGHHHRERAAIGRRRLDHRLVAGEVRLRRQDVHRLGAGDARHPLHRQRLESGRGVSLDRLAAPQRIERTDQQRALARRPSSVAGSGR